MEPTLTPATALAESAVLLDLIHRDAWMSACRALAEMNTRDAVAVSLLLSNVLTPAERARLVRLVAL